LSQEQEKTNGPVNVSLINYDKDSVISKNFIDLLGHSNIKIDQFDENSEEEAVIDWSKKENKTAVLMIPQGYELSLKNNVPAKIRVYTIVKNFSAMGGKDYGNLMAALANANESISNLMLSQKASGLDPTSLKNPVQSNEYIIVGNRQANVSPNIVMGFVTQQTMFIPIILFIVIIFSAQMIATAIANEKENKTLETLLTLPVSRNAIVTAKMAAAGLVALLASLIYILSFRSYINGLTGGQKISSEISNVINQLGLNLSPQNYLLLGLSLFVGILIALSIALILGAFAEDVKGVAGIISPLMVLVLIPYFLTMFLDINNLSPGLRNLTYAIPFSHIFMAAPNLFLHNYMAVIWGILYQVVWFIVFVLIAARIFSTDLIMTLKLNFSNKKPVAIRRLFKTGSN
jgi:ABC-2 type transport system permease protein